MKKNSSYMKVDGLGKVPLKETRSQGGLKRKIIKLVNHMPAPHRECETTDFLMALQHVLDEHNLRPLGNIQAAKLPTTKIIKGLVAQIRDLQSMCRALEELNEERRNKNLQFLKELKEHFDKGRKGDKASFDYVDEMISDWIQELEDHD